MQIVDASTRVRGQGQGLQMRKAELVAAVAQELDMTYVKAEEAVNEILGAIKETLARGESVTCGALAALRCAPSRLAMGVIRRQASTLRLPPGASCALRSRLGSTSGKHFKAAVGGDSEAV